MNKYRPQLIACLSVAASAFGAHAGSPRDYNFLKTPIGVAVKQGIDSTSPCNALVMKAPQFSSCVLSAQQSNAKKGGDSNAYDLGLYFDAWYSMDMLARPDPDDAPASDFVKQAGAAAKPEAARYFKLYREVQKKLRVADDQLIVLYELNKPELLKARIASAARETGA